SASNTVGSYFILSFSYRFRNFRGAQRREFRERNMEDMPEMPERMRGGGRDSGEGGGGFGRGGFEI
ncbi:MAG: hypothetical protein LBQ01_10010, partial [Prevotellaceae bacterium]|nr:hypothetical protein [Prevotellaceae bacterium]